jgi:hypothetical protein
MEGQFGGYEVMRRGSGRDGATIRKERLDKIRGMLRPHISDETPLEWKRVVAQISLNLGVTERRVKEYMRTLANAEMIGIDNHKNELWVYEGSMI